MKQHTATILLHINKFTSGMCLFRMLTSVCPLCLIFLLSDSRLLHDAMKPYQGFNFLCQHLPRAAYLDVTNYSKHLYSVDTLVGSRQCPFMVLVD